MWRPGQPPHYIKKNRVFMVEIKKLGFGLMRLPLMDGNDPTSIDYEQVCRMVDTFIDRGFTYFDTAYMYHNGESEKMVKKALVSRHKRDTFTLATKMPTMHLRIAGDMPRIFAEQCEKCGVDYFDYYLIHCLNTGLYDTATRLKTFEFCENLKREGKIKKLGFSFHDKADVLERILHDHPDVDFIQLQINYLDWEDAGVQSRLCYEVARKYDKNIVIMEPVKGGTLASVPEGVEKMFKEINPDLSVPSWAIRFVAGLPNVAMVLSGMSNYEQLLDNTSYMQDFKPLSEAEMDAVWKAADMIKTKISIGCTACHYCTDGCPMQIPIPEIFNVVNRRKGQPEFRTLREYAIVTTDKGKASDCIACGQCEAICPQHLPIIELLEKARALEA